MRKGIPNLGALQAFEATARLGTFSRAAEELALTHSAVHRQVAGLEARLGVQLFTRVRRRIALTEAGAAYAARVRYHLEQLEKDTFGLVSQAGIGRSLHLAVLPTLATTWLAPRLADFHQRHPDIAVSLSVRTLQFRFDDHPFDAAIYHANQPWPHTAGIKLFDEGELVPVCHPDLIGPDGSLAGLPHLHMSSRPEAWRTWYEARGMTCPVAVNAGPRYELFSMLMAAVCARLGVTLVPRLLVQPLLDRGDLAQAAPDVLKVRDAYYFGYPASSQPSDALLAFRDWLAEQAGGRGV